MPSICHWPVISRLLVQLVIWLGTEVRQQHSGTNCQLLPVLLLSILLQFQRLWAVLTMKVCFYVADELLEVCTAVKWQNCLVRFSFTLNACTLWTEKNTPKCFWSFLPQVPADFNKIWCVLSWINFSYTSLNVFHLAWVMSLHYLVKLSIRVLQVNSKPKKNTPKCFCHIVYGTRPILIKFCTCCPEYICHRVVYMFSTSPKQCLCTTL